MVFESVRFSKSARLVAELGKIQPGDNVCLVTDTGMLSIAPAVAAACTAAGGETVVCLMSPRNMPGNAPPPMVAAAMKEAKVVIMVTTKNMFHTRASSAARDAGVRIVNMRQMTEDLFASDTLTPDYKKMYEETRRIADLLDQASEARITSAQGTDISMSLAGRTAMCNSGPFDPGNIMTLPSGEAAIAPVEGTLDGTLVVDYAIDGIGVLSSPIKVTAKKGRATSIEGGKEAEKLREAISKADANACNFAELAIGTNPNSRLVGNIAEDKKKRGSAHIAIGDSVELGGTSSSRLHLDMILLKPNVWLDGKQIVAQGEFSLY